MHDSAATLLVVDDVPMNVQILEKGLRRSTAWNVIGMHSGKEVIDFLTHSQYRPDLMLLDLRMPEMDGFEVLKRLKEIPGCENLPVIVITAQANDSEDVAFDLGAVDFITKPFEMHKVILRIRSHLELKRHRDELELLVAERSRQLLHADRMASLGVLSAGIAHEINNPVTFIAGNIQTLERFCEALVPALVQRDLSTLSADKLDFVIEEIPKTLEGMRQGVARVERIVQGLKRFAHPAPPTRIACSFNQIIEDSLSLVASRLKHIHIEKFLDQQITIWADPGQIEQVLVNLITNAADALEETRHPVITLKIAMGGRFAFLFVEDNGPGIPIEKSNQIFHPFYTTKPPGKGTGLGLSISLGIAEAHQGSLSAQRKSDGGSSFLLALPRGES